MTATALWLLCSTTAVAAQSEGLVQLHFAQRSEPAENDAVSVTVLGRQTDQLSTSAESLAKCGLEASCTLHLMPGLWTLSFSSPGWFLRDSQILVQPGKQDVSVEMRRTGLVRATLKPMGMPLPTLTARFSSSTDSGADVPCIVERDAFECAIPWGTWDVRIGAPGFISQYYWDVAVDPDDELILGRFALQRGSSFVGMVDFATGLASGSEVGRIEDAVVIITEVGADGKSSVTGRPNAKGFFQFPTIAAGTYRVLARLGTLESDSREIKILSDREANLRDPLLLDRPKQLTVQTHPPRDPHDQPWKLEVAEITKDGRRILSPVSETLSDVGEAIVGRLRTGSYRVSILDSNGSTWARQRIQIGSTDESLTFDTDSVRVRGKLSYLERPLSASLRFRNRESGSEVTMVSDNDGEFRGVVPALADSWQVRVESRDPSVARDLVVDLRPIDGEAELNIPLPSSGLDGRVLDQDGTAVTEGGIVTLSDEKQATMVQGRLLEDGTFAFHGLETGSYQLRVSTYSQRESDTIQIQIEEDEIAAVDVLVKENEGLLGIVTFRGRPVPGATVWSFPVGSGQLFFIPRTTDETGRFRALLPSGSAEVDFLVQAGGFATRLLRQGTSNREVAIELEQQGGILEVDLPPPNTAPNAVHPFLMHERAWIPARMLTRGAQELEQGVSSQIHVEPGVYVLCLASNLSALQAGAVPSQQCITGTVPYGGASRLDIRPLMQGEGR